MQDVFKNKEKGRKDKLEHHQNSGGFVKHSYFVTSSVMLVVGHFIRILSCLETVL